MKIAILDDYQNVAPHIGYATDRAYRTFYKDLVEDILAFASGHPVRQL